MAIFVNWNIMHVTLIHVKMVPLVSNSHIIHSPVIAIPELRVLCAKSTKTNVVQLLVKMEVRVERRCLRHIKLHHLILTSVIA